MADRFWGELSKLFDRNLEGLIATVFLLLVIEGRVYRFRYVSLPFFPCNYILLRQSLMNDMQFWFCKCMGGKCPTGESLQRLTLSAQVFQSYYTTHFLKDSSPSNL